LARSHLLFVTHCQVYSTSSSQLVVKILFAIFSNENAANGYLHDLNIVLVTQLQEEVESLKKTVAAKDKELIEKERKVFE